MVTTKKNSASKKEVESTSNRKALTEKSPAKAAPKKSSAMRRSTAAAGSTTAKSGTKKADSTTTVTVKYDVGFPNQLYLRGEGPDLELSWEEGVPLKNAAPDTWVWETRKPFGQATFKVLINDEHFEDGENHSLTQGTSIEYTPTF